MNDPATLNSMLEARLFYCQGIRLLSESIHSDERRVTLTTLLFAILLPRDLLQREPGFPHPLVVGGISVWTSNPIRRER